MNHHIATSSIMTETHRLTAAPARTPSGLAASLCLTLILALAWGLAGCSSFNNSVNASNINPVNWITPYRVDVIQGNFLSKEQVAALKPGMTRAQVKDILGTPLVSSLFHQDRWDYVFTLKRQGVEPQSFKYTVLFKGDQLDKFEGDTMPTEAEFIATLASVRKFGKPPALEATEEQLKSAEKAASSKAPTTEVAKTTNAAAAPPTVYPPLEGVRR
jgi:outer membrane protein assembly factor BamE